MGNNLTQAHLCKAAADFVEVESKADFAELFGVDNGKTIGTFFEKRFQKFLSNHFDFEIGNAASGLDFPSLNIDMKVTSIKQPQSSCPYRSASQKIFGLGYGLLLFVYEKFDDQDTKTSRLEIRHSVFVDASLTADFQTTRGIREILKRDGNRDDLIAFFMDRNLPIDEIEANNLATAILKTAPKQGYLTISNALQWRLQYQRVIDESGKIDGLQRVL